MNGREETFPFPIRGRDDALTSHRQQADSTREASNVISRVMHTGRYQGGRRPGSRKATPSLGGAARGVTDLVVDTRHVAYESLAAPTSEWTADGPSGRDAYSVRVDATGDVYTLEGGTHIVIRNSAGVERATIVIPVDETAMRCRALEVDAQSRVVYVAVSTGGSQARAKLWAYFDRPYVGWSVLWAIEPGMYIEKLVLRGDTLHAAANDTKTGKAYVVAFTTLQTVATEQWREEVPAPANTLAVDAKTGKVAVGSGVNADRGKDPRYPETGQILSRSFASQWLTDLPNYGVRAWATFDAEEVDLDLGNDVFAWDDVGGSNRQFVVPGQQVQLVGATTLMGGAQPNVGDTINFSTPDGAISETYTFRATPAAAGDVDIGGTLNLTLANLEDAIENGGDGTSAYPGTQPSSLVYVQGPNRLNVNTQREAVVVTLTYASTTQIVLDGSLSTVRILSAKTVQPTPPKLQTGIAGRRCLHFDGVSAKMWTGTNPNKLASAADEQNTFWPGYGIAQATASSARFASFVVCKPYSTYSRSCLLAQSVENVSGGSWVRRIVSNRGSAGTYSQGQLGVVERDGSTTRTHAASYLSGGAANFTLISQVSNPTGNYEVYINGEPALNGVGAGTGTAVANDSLERTALGQSSYTTEDERFWHGDVYLMFVVHSLTDAPITTNERQAIEGILAWHFGAQGQLPVTHPYYSTPPAPPDGSVADFHLARRALTTTPLVTKLDAKSHDIAWMAASEPAGDSIGALGYGLAWHSDGDLYSVGRPTDYADDPASVRRIVDKDDDYSLDTADGAWSANLGASAAESFSYDKLELAVDEWDNLFVPFFADGYGAAPLQFLAYSETGTLLLSPAAEQAQAAYGVAVNLPTPEYGEGSTINRPELVTLALRRESTAAITFSGLPSPGDQVTISSTVGGVPVAETYTFESALALANDVLIGASPTEMLANFAAAVNKGAGSGTVYHASTPRSALASVVGVSGVTATLVARTYEGDTTVASSTVALQFEPDAPDELTLTTGSVRQIRLVDTSSIQGTGRIRRRVAVVGSNLVRFDDTDSQPITGGVGVIDSTARYFHSVSLFRWTFTTDGQRSWVYDSRTDKVAEFVATKGTVPKRVQIWETWRARLVALNSADNPARHYEAAAGDPFDWDFQPPVQRAGQAWNSGLPPSFDIPDVLNGWIPVDDDNAIIIGDSTLWWQTGDTALSGQADQITRGVGGAFGRAWCIGPRGEAYIWTSQSEVAMVTREGVRSITNKRISRVLEAVNLSTHFIRMAWDHRQDALLVIACPYNGVDSGNRVFQWEPAVDAWWELEFAASGHRVHDLTVINGDEVDDRHVMFLQADGYGRTWDADSDTDDGETIHSHVLIGPLAWKDARLQAQMSLLQVLLDGQSGDCYVEVWSSDRPSDKGRMRYRGTIRPGMSPQHLVRATGNYLWLVLRGTRRWAFESASAIFEPVGLKRRL
jgi:hypothetical protein